MKKYYKILYGFTPETYIGINESEIEKAFFVQMEKKDAIFSGGSIRGSLIMEVVEDFHRTMGWNRGYKLNEYDYAELKDRGIDKQMRNMLSECKQKVEHLMKTKQTHLIGKNIDLPKNISVDNEVKKLSDKFKI